MKSSSYPKPKPLSIIEMLWFNFRKLQYIIIRCKNTQCSMTGVAYPYPHWDLVEEVCPVCKTQLVTGRELENYLTSYAAEK